MCWLKAIVPVAILWTVVPAAPATADTGSYIYVLENAGLIDGDGDLCNTPPSAGYGCQFQTVQSALYTGYQVCSDLALGRTREQSAALIASGDGLGPDQIGGAIVYDAAVAHLC